MLPSFARQRVTIVTPGTRIERGHEVLDWGTTTEAMVPCIWEMGAPAQSSSDGLDTILGTRTVYLNPGAPVTGACRLRFPDDPGTDWVIVGEPAANTSPTGAVSNIQVSCRRWGHAQ
ncbi:hypothetical protein CWT12_12260 [Actinomyces sp. 432]|uniref:hypothetical protein n=1 Tax=Actinomyces sp. 432 TaxID=2057798 RepID=UPI001374406D|nr:hypothetical protein [Actinomyces sp. 432]QHO91925.1 hypothetical protein CWT12_12260 [Actinomyces sp. 432]